MPDYPIDLTNTSSSAEWILQDLSQLVNSVDRNFELFPSTAHIGKCSLRHAPFDCLRRSGSVSVASNNVIGSQKYKNTNVQKKVNSIAHPLPELVEGGSLINAPFDTLC